MDKINFEEMQSDAQEILKKNDYIAKARYRALLESVLYTTPQMWQAHIWLAELYINNFLDWDESYAKYKKAGKIRGDEVGFLSSVVESIIKDVKNRSFLRR